MARMVGRRAAMAAVGAALAGTGPARADAPPRERWLWVQNAAGEEVATAYRAGQDYNLTALARLQHLFRDLRVQTPGPVPGLLLDMLSLIQERFGYTRPIRLISGYRTPQTNAMLPHAAPNSLHMRGWAADIIIPGLSQTDVVTQAMTFSNMFGFMGVGWYGSFTHIDIGPKASWARSIS